MIFSLLYYSCATVYKHHKIYQLKMTDLSAWDLSVFFFSEYKVVSFTVAKKKKKVGVLVLADAH